MTFNTCFNRILNYKHRFGQVCCWFHSTNVWINGWRWKINVESLCQISVSHILTKVYGLLQCISVKNLTFMWRTISSVKWKRYSMGLIEVRYTMFAKYYMYRYCDHIWSISKMASLNLAVITVYGYNLSKTHFEFSLTQFILV